MNIIDYIDKFGDKSFTQKEMNEIDKLIFSLLSYVEYKGIVSENSHNKKTIKEVGDIFFKNITKKEIKKQIIPIKMAIGVFDKIRDKRRYKDLLLYNDIYIGDENQQFSAVCIEIEPKLVYVSFEGTDYLVSGWKEDCELAYKFPVKSHKQAVKYLNRYFMFKNCKLILGGHSKGGNLALVAGMNCNMIIRNKITEIYSYDGPGLRKKQIDSFRYKRIKNKYTHIIPNYCIVGLLLRNDGNYKVIKTNHVGIMAHDPTTWQLESDDFKKVELSTFSKLLDKGISAWLDKYNDEERELLVKCLFEIFENNNITSFMEIMENYKLILDLLKSAKKLNPIVKDMAKDLIKVLIECNKEYIKSKFNRKRDVELEKGLDF